jgi:class 3 adenylate cyclase
MIGAWVQLVLKRARERRFVLGFALLPIALLAAALSVLAVAHFSVLTETDRFIQDSEIARVPPSEPQDPDIVFVAVNEDTLQQFPYRSPLDRAFIAQLLDKLAADHPRVIGLDFLFDQPTEPAKDALLEKTIAKFPLPLVVAYTQQGEVVTEQQKAYLDKFVPPKARGLINLAEDQFQTVRGNYAGEKLGSRYLMSFARAVAADAGVRSAPVTTPMAWHGRPDDKTPAFKEFPAHLVPFLPPAWFRNRIVLIGSDVSLTDRHRTPFTTLSTSGMLPGTLILAHAVAQILHHTAPPFASDGENFLIALLCAALGGLLGALNYPLLPRIAAALFCVALLWIIGGTAYHVWDHMIGLLAPTIALFIGFAGMDSLTGREARRQRHFIQNAFSQYVSPKVVEKLVENPGAMALEGERREMTYLFSDIEGFTTFSEEIDSRELARILNAYFDGATEIVMRHGGMVDKFIGDAVFAIFNAPVDVPEHAECAVKCALEFDSWSQNYRAALAAQGYALGCTRIGIHTGYAVIGNFGSRRRFNYTAQGDAVNAASRLESLNKQFGTRICVSGVTRSLCRTVAFRPVASVVLKGKSLPLDVFEPLRDGERSNGFLERYLAAFAELEKGSPEADRLFGELEQEAPDDPCVALHVARIKHGARGVAMVMAEK